MTATGQPKYHQGFEPVVEGFDFAQFNDITSFETTLERHEAQAEGRCNAGRTAPG